MAQRRNLVRRVDLDRCSLHDPYDWQVASGTCRPSGNSGNFFGGFKYLDYRGANLFRGEPNMAEWLQSFAVVLCFTAPLAWAENPVAVARPTSEALAQARLAVRAAIVTATSRYPGDSACSEMLRLLHHNL